MQAPVVASEPRTHVTCFCQYCQVLARERARRAIEGFRESLEWNASLAAGSRKVRCSSTSIVASATAKPELSPRLEASHDLSAQLTATQFPLDNRLVQDKLRWGGSEPDDQPRDGLRG